MMDIWKGKKTERRRAYWLEVVFHVPSVTRCVASSFPQVKLVTLDLLRACGGGLSLSPYPSEAVGKCPSRDGRL